MSDRKRLKVEISAKPFTDLLANGRWGTVVFMKDEDGIQYRWGTLSEYAGMLDIGDTGELTARVEPAASDERKTLKNVRWTDEPY